MRLDPDSTGPATPFTADGWRGLRDERIEVDAIRDALAAHAARSGAILKRDLRSLVMATEAGGLGVVVKEVRKPGLLRRVADRFRGTPAQRSFEAGRRLLDYGVGAALPLAAVWRDRLGIPWRSVSVSLDLREDPTAAELLDRGSPTTRAAALLALSELLVGLHRAGVRHGDLRAQHVHLRSTGAGGYRGRLVDLESVRFGAPPDDDTRLDDWGQIGGSIPDAHADRALRRSAFAYYHAALPFRSGLDAAFDETIRRSIAREHLFRGDGELLGDGSDRAPTSTG